MPIDQIGSDNAEHTLHIHIDFRRISGLPLQSITIKDNRIHILEKIQNNCINLRTVTTSLSSTNTAACELSGLNSPQVVVKALMFVSARFRAIPSLQKIIVEVYEWHLSFVLR